VILVDTSVWVDHLRSGDARLSAKLEGASVVMHPMVLGELACGNLKDRETLLALWRNLPQLVAATDAEALFFLERNRLWGRGIGGKTGQSPCGRSSGRTAASSSTPRRSARPTCPSWRLCASTITPCAWTR